MRGRGRGSGRAQSAVGRLHTCTLALLEGDVIDEAACIDVRRVRLRAGTLVECTPGSVQGTVQGGRPECCPGVGVGTGVGVAISRSRRDLAAAHVSQIELAPATYDVVELVARLLAKVRAGAGVEGGVEGSSTREQGPCCRGRAAGPCCPRRVHRLARELLAVRQRPSLRQVEQLLELAGRQLVEVPLVQLHLVGRERAGPPVGGDGGGVGGVDCDEDA